MWRTIEISEQELRQVLTIIQLQFSSLMFEMLAPHNSPAPPLRNNKNSSRQLHYKSFMSMLPFIKTMDTFRPLLKSYPNLTTKISSSYTSKQPAHTTHPNDQDVISLLLFDPLGQQFLQELIASNEPPSELQIADESKYQINRNKSQFTPILLNHEYSQQYYTWALKSNLRSETRITSLISVHVLKKIC